MTNGEQTPVPSAIPWYQSPVYIGAVVTVVSSLVSVTPKLATELGLTSSDAISHFVDTIFGFIALVAGVFTAVKRGQSAIQPITMTKGGAATHPVTLANQPPTVTPPEEKAP